MGLFSKHPVKNVEIIVAVHTNSKRFFILLFIVDDLEGREWEVGVFGKDGALVGRLGQVAEALGVLDVRGGDDELGAF